MFCIVTARPNLTTHPVPTTVKAEQLNVIALSCLAIGMSPIYYQWEKYHLSNNSWINPSHRAVNIASPNLKFNIVTEEDEGVYRCIATNDDGSVISNNASINVYSEFTIYSMIYYMHNNVKIGPPIIHFISNHTVSLEGDKVHLICIAINDVDAIHPLQINWYKRNKHIILNNETTKSRQLNSTLLLNPVNYTDDEEYTCRAFNHQDSYSELKTTLIVECKAILNTIKFYLFL